MRFDIEQEARDDSDLPMKLREVETLVDKIPAGEECPHSQVCLWPGPRLDD